MKVNIINLFASKRFIAFGVSSILFVILLFTTNYTPIEIAGGLAMIAGIYIGAESYRKSDSNTKNIG